LLTGAGALDTGLVTGAAALETAGGAATGTLAPGSAACAVPTSPAQQRATSKSSF
jgi:hypothetical protein